jgi:hypothetical protein
MRRLGAHCLVVAMKRGNARGAKGVGHQRWIGSTGVGSTGSGRNLIINGRRQPSHGGTSRMMREYHVRICEGLGVQLPGSTRQCLCCWPCKTEATQSRFFPWMRLSVIAFLADWPTRGQWIRIYRRPLFFFQIENPKSDTITTASTAPHI